MKKVTLLLSCILFFSITCFAPELITTEQEIEVRYERMQKEARFFSLYNQALNKLKEFEGLSLVAYTDGKGKTIGYGHFIERFEDIPVIITEEEAEALLRIDFEESIQTVEKSTGYDRFNDPEKVLALAHFVFNVGGFAFERSTLLKNLQARQTINHEIVRWNKTTINGEKVTLPHLTMRRHYELNLFYS
jgi:GH24 family phage-related lysozyme (muramidase)